MKTNSTNIIDKIGVVIIGRNEGNRLVECFNSIIGKVNRIIYVDSGSTDNSVNNAINLNIDVIQLDMSIPFTAARARNAGYKKMIDTTSIPEFIQFVDGDCKICDGWLEKALTIIENIKDVAIVYGRRREEFPDKTPYNKFVDMEWKKPVGESESCGGDSLIRMKAFREVNGFNESLIAGEEPEMCLRLRRKGWRIINTGLEMTLHDVNIIRFEQLWKRSERCGHAYFDGFILHGLTKDHYRVRQIISIFFWTLVVPIISIGLIPVSNKFSLFILGSYLYLWNRIRKYRITMKDTKSHAAKYAFFCTVLKFAELEGILKNIYNRIINRKPEIIEYK